MRIHALLSYFDEPAPWLAATVASVARFAEHVIAMDGAYLLFGGCASPPEQAETIMRTAEALDLACTIHRPREPWIENEVGKRSASLKVASALADPGDWLLIIDADEVLVQTGTGTIEALTSTELLVAEITEYERLPHEERFQGMDRSAYPTRRIVRIIEDMRVVGVHSLITGTHLGRTVTLTGPEELKRERALPLPDVVLEHRNSSRDPDRLAKKAAYYALRDALGAETVPVP